MIEIPHALREYHAQALPKVCELGVEPWHCEFWQLAEVASLNADYGVPEFAPGHVGFGSSGGGDMFAFSPSGAVVCLAFVGMSPAEALLVASS